MTVTLHTRASQLVVMTMGWLLLGWMCALVEPLAGLGVLIAVFLYVGVTYPIRSDISSSSVVVRSLLRSRTVAWDDVLSIRRTKGPLRRQTINGRRRYRTSPGALLLVLEGGGTLLVVGQTESIEHNRALVEVVAQASPALADSLCLALNNGQ